VKLPEGLYEQPITLELEAALAELTMLIARSDVTIESAPQVFARLIHDATVLALRNVAGDERLAAQVALTNRLLTILSEAAPRSGITTEDAVRVPPELLMSVRAGDDVRLGTAQIARPTLPLRHSDLLVNGPRDLRIGHEVPLELASADRVDLLVAFVKWSGYRLLRSDLEHFLARRPGALRVLTTTYLGASEPEAIEALIAAGARVKVSYDSRRTRLHAKAWLFHRDSGFSTGIVGSSNLSVAAMLDGAEWNVRLAAVDNATILAKFATTFDQYWDDPEFEPYARDRFIDATRRRDESRDALARAVQLRPYPHQQGVLDALAVERSHGHTRNLIVAATGTGKTVIAALDYARLRKDLPDPSLLFVAHRQEILKQSLATFRAAVRDGHFGELLVGDERPTIGRHVFASIQALHAKRLATLAPDAYDVVIVDEFHHAHGDTYQALLNKLTPKVLIGLTATPERADGESVLHWFGHRIAAELRLWDALDQGLVVPFQYFGIHDGTDLSAIDFSGGRYDIASLEHLYTADHERAKRVLRALYEHVNDVASMRALGFCVSVKHAEFMAAYCSHHGVPAQAVSAETPTHARNEALRKLAVGEIKALFSRDLLNEGVDIPSVNTVLFLRPTESATVFLQQLGRGLRHEDGKSCLTVLDFIGDANRRFRFVDRYRALVGGTHAAVRRAVEDGFPFLPSGCDIKLDRASQRAVLQNIRASIGATTDTLVDDARQLGDVTVAQFLAATELDLDDLYKNGRCLTNIKRAAGVLPGAPSDDTVTRATSRMLHVDDDDRLSRWRAWLSADHPPPPEIDEPLQLMLFAILGHAPTPLAEMRRVFDEVWPSDLRRELVQLFDVLADQQRRPTHPLDGVPFRVHATYTRDEISAGLREIRKGKLLRTQGGVYSAEAIRADILYVTLNKDPKHFTPTTLYKDYPISPTRFHWETQGGARAESRTVRRYRGLADQPWRMLFFVRRDKYTSTGVSAPYLFLGPVRYLSHESEKPVRIVWELERPMPASFFSEVKVAAG
jgi:superfamily II DNA or RNA helicase/HKD family nuclease